MREGADDERDLQAALLREEQQRRFVPGKNDVIIGEPSYGPLAFDDGRVQTYAVPNAPKIDEVDLASATTPSVSHAPELSYLLQRAGQGAVNAAVDLFVQPIAQLHDLGEPSTDRCRA